MSLAQKLQATYSQNSKENPPEKVLREFIAVRAISKTNEVDLGHIFSQKDPHSRYTFDSERDASHSELCREGKELNRECITMFMHSAQLFRAMQDQGFFCALPMDPTQTHMECVAKDDNPVDKL